MTSARRFYPEGVHLIPSTLTIPRQRTNMGLGVPANVLYPTSGYSLPASCIRGRDRYGTVLKFAEGITGALIETEGYGSGKTSTWNQNNTDGDRSLLSIMCPLIQDLTIDGSAAIRPYPNAPAEGWPQPPLPDYNGPDFIPVASGIRVRAESPTISNVGMFNIPGTGIVLTSVESSSGGPFSIYELTGAKVLDNIQIAQSHTGIDLTAVGDLKISNIFLNNLCKDGLLNGNACYLDTCHIQGCDRGYVAAAACRVTDAYIESCRIGTYIPAGADEVRINGLDIGPGTCYYRGVQCLANYFTLLNLGGAVKAEDDTYPDIAGVEINSGGENTVSGILSIHGTSTGLLLNGGDTNNIDLQLSLFSACKGVEVTAALTKSHIKLRLYGSAGIGLDLTSSTLNTTNGLGNIFELFTVDVGSMTPIKYPGGGTVFNLAEGSKVYINGELQ